MVNFLILILGVSWASFYGYKFLTGFGWGGHSRGLVKPKEANYFHRIWIFVNVLIGIGILMIGISRIWIY